jgi:hypothetical protein
LDEGGKVVRSYSSKEDHSTVQFPGGPSADPTMTDKVGLNRWVWDMRYPTLPGVPPVFIEGSYEGRKVAPGVYQARLKYDTIVRTVSFRVLGDPRIAATTAEYAEQQEWQAKTEDGIRDIHESVLRLRKVRKQIDEVVELVGSRPEMKEVVDSGKKISARLLKWEEELVQNKAQSNDDIINFINKLSADYIFLKGEMDANIPYVTVGQKTRYAELDGQWKVLRAQMNGLLDRDVAGFNALCRGKAMEKVIVPEK